jgi:hypothetical protein
VRRKIVVVKEEAKGEKLLFKECARSWLAGSWNLKWRQALFARFLKGTSNPGRFSQRIAPDPGGLAVSKPLLQDD